MKKIMKHFTYLVSALALCLLFAAGCDKISLKPAESITVQPATVSLPATGGTQTVSVTVANAADWSATSDATWLTVTKDGTASLRVAAPLNTEGARSASVRCTAGTATATISVSQAQPTATQSDSLALVDLYNAAAGSAWTRKWTLSQPLGQWSGVTVANGRVTELKLRLNNVTGALPVSFGNLRQLQYCDLSNNQLSGAVPTVLNQLTQLAFLDLSENAFSGAFPAVGALTKLLVLDISFNAFTTLPALNSLTALEYLAFSKNSLSGALPGTWSALTNLIYLDGSFNTFSGSLPAAWSSLGKLQAFYLYKNTLTGTLPAYLGAFVELQTLALDGNNFTGSIPDNLGDLPKLEELWLAQNRLGGVIPASLLANSRWNTWESNVCPQQSGYGFSNCNAQASQALPTAASRQTDYKEKYRRQ
jgi:hypothetical protein